MKIKYLHINWESVLPLDKDIAQIVIARIALILLGFLLVYLGIKGTLEPLIMVPMGLGMLALLLSGIGGIVGDYIVYLFKRGNN